MGTLTSAQFLTAMRVELSDGGSVWTDAELTRGMTKAVALMSRMIPKRAITEQVVTITVSSETLTIASGTGTLSNVPVKQGTLTISGYTEGVADDYTVNYLTGVVTAVSGGDLSDGDYTVSYSIDPYMINLTGFLTDYIRITRIEYPVGDSPRSYIVPEDIFATYIKLKDELSQNKSYRIEYDTYWTAPGAAVGDYPSSLDNVLIIGAVGQALIYKAETHTQTAITNVAASKTLLDAITAVSAPSAATISTQITNAQTALAAAITRLESAVTQIGNMATPLTNAATALGKIAAEVALGNGYLDSGSALITTINDAAKVAENYALYAQSQTQISDGYGREADRDVNLGLAYEAYSAREMAIGNSYLNEAIQRMTIAARNIELYEAQIAGQAQDVAYFNAQVAQAREYQSTARQYLEIAGRYLSSGQAKINEMLVGLGLKPEFNMYRSSSEQPSW